MFRLFFSTAMLFGVSSLIVDSALKGAAILVLALIGTWILKRNSAATRHLVWVVALLLVFALPFFTAVLPGWKVLPEWTAITQSQNQESRNLHSIDVDKANRVSSDLPIKPECVWLIRSEVGSWFPSVDCFFRHVAQII